MLPASPLVIRADILRARADAAALLAEARAEAARLRAEAEADAEAARASGREDGRRAGEAEAARLVAAASEAADAFLAAREAELGTLALAVAHRLIGALPPEERLFRLVQTALAEHRAELRLALRVPPGDAAGLRAALAEVDPDGRVTVEEDPAAAPGSCVLAHARGRTAIGLLDQFRALLAGVEAMP